MVLSNPRLLRTGVSDSQLYSGSWSEPPVAGCRLGTMVRSRQRTRVRRAHSFGCHKHRVRFGLRWTLAISGTRRCTDCGPSCSSRPADPWATDNRPGLGELPVQSATLTDRNLAQHRQAVCFIVPWVGNAGGRLTCLFNTPLRQVRDTMIASLFPGLYSLARDCFRFDLEMVVATKAHYHRNPGNGNEK